MRDIHSFRVLKERFLRPWSNSLFEFFGLIESNPRFYLDNWSFFFFGSLKIFKVLETKPAMESMVE